MKYRIAIWASGGFLVAWFWGIYFAVRSKDIPIGPLVNHLSRLTCPIMLMGSYFHSGISLYSVLVTNIAIYALLGLIVETLRRQLKHAS